MKLKGVTDSKVDKKKKKKKTKKDNKEKEDTLLNPADDVASPVRDQDQDQAASASNDKSTERPDATGSPIDGAYVGKTEAEKRHEEMRRKRVCWHCASSLHGHPIERSRLMEIDCS